MKVFSCQSPLTGEAEQGSTCLEKVDEVKAREGILWSDRHRVDA